MFEPKDSASTPPPSSEPARGQLLTYSQSTRRLGVAGRTLRGWVAAGRIRVVRLSRRTVRIEEEELLRFIRENRDGGPMARRNEN